MKQLFTVALLLFYTTIFAQDIDLGLIGHWLMNDDDEMLDQSITGLDGIIVGATYTTDRFGVDDEALEFDGGGDYAVLSDALDDVTTVDDATFSISLWHRTGDLIPALSPLICKYAHSGCGDMDRQWGVMIAVNEGIRFYWAETPDNVNYRSVSTGSLIMNDLETWFHIVVTYDGSVDTNDGQDRVQIFIDNELQPDTLIFSEGNLGQTMTDGNAPIGFMNYVSTNDGNCGQFNAPGALDDFRVYDRVLQEGDVEALFIEGATNVDEQVAFDAAFTLYPNIIDEGVFNLNCTQVYENVEVEILSIQGAVLQRVLFSQMSGPKTISLKDISAGTYLVKLSNEAGLLSTKRVVVR